MTFDLHRSWNLSGTASEHYTMKTEEQLAAASGGVTGDLMLGSASPEGFGTLVQTLPADKYRGKHIVFSADVKTDNVTKNARIWQRANGQKEEELLVIDNVGKHGLTGSTDWIPGNVPEEAGSISLGFLINGSGSGWIKNPKIAI